MKNTENRFTSRKLWMSISGIILMASLPIAFTHVGVAKEVQMLSLASIAFATGIYVHYSVKDKLGP